MPSFISWLDTSERDRRRAMDVIDLFKEQDSRDELGIGTVRDAFSNLLVPGVSTIMTRAAYYLFVPWICLRQEKKRTPSAAMAEEVRKDEIALITSLVKDGDMDGLIGKQVREALLRMPSSIYWQGLSMWGIRLFPGPRESYYRSLDRFYRLQDRSTDGFEGEGPSDAAGSNWHPGLPAAPKSFPSSASMALTRECAEYLADRVLTRVPGTLLAHLVDRSRPWDHTDFPWGHPEVQDFPPRIREILENARCFSESISGSALLYNLLLAELSSNEERIAYYREALEAWSSLMDARAAALARWDRAKFWAVVVSEGARVPIGTRTFIDRWLDLVLAPGGASSAGKAAATRALVGDREIALKRNRSRIQNPAARELWSGAAGTLMLNYRWGETQTIVGDIHRGLGRKATHA